MSRFNLLSGLAPSLEESGNAWAMTPLGWTLVLSPFVALVVGVIWGAINKNDDSKMSDDILS